MNLENVTAELRPRSPWEAADFGARMIRRDAATIYRVWFAVTIPLVALTTLAIVYGPYPTLAVLAYWWLEPVADGPMLHVISRRLFGETASARAALRALPSLAWRNRIFLISPYRFHIARSIAMPLTQLEGMSGKSRRARARVLSPKIMRYGAGVTIAFQHLALALYIGVILIGFAFVPPQYQDTIGSNWISQFYGDEGRSAVVVGFVVAYLAQTALQPWFVGSGFGLYINCRTELEAWDLEIAFRRMAQRRAGHALAAALVAMAVLVPMIAVPSPAAAQEPDAEQGGVLDAEQGEVLEDSGFPWYWSDDAVRPAVDEIMSSDELKMTREIETWQRIDQKQALQPDPAAGVLGRLLAGIGRALASVFELALWIVIAVLVAAVIVAVARWRPSIRSSGSGGGSPKRVILAGGEISADTLPDDVPGEALKLWRAGGRRQAMSLLYRGSVFAAVNRHGVRLPPSATEGMCIAAVEQQAEPAQAEFFRKLVTAWMWCAYAARDPGDDFMASACAQWPRYFGAAR